MRIKRQRVLTVVNPGRIIAGQRSLLRGRHVSSVCTRRRRDHDHTETMAAGGSR